MTPARRGNTAKAKFCNISIIPNPVPSSSGGQIIGTVGTMMAQKMAMQIPSKNTGIHGIIIDYLIVELV